MSVARRILLQRRLAQYVSEQGIMARNAGPRDEATSKISGSIAHSPLQRRFQSTFSEAYQQASPSPPKPSIPARLLFTFTGAVVFFSFGMLVGWQTLPARDQARALIVSRPMSNEETNNAYTPPDPGSASINTHILQHSLSRTLRANPDFQESRPHLKIPEAIRKLNLTGGTLAGPGRIAVPPVQFVENGGRSFFSIVYLGEQLCGHPGIVHGGLLATLLDEGLARCCFPAMPNNIGVTANLKLDYRKPVKADGYYVVRARTVRVEGRKAWVKGWIEPLGEQTSEDGEVEVDASGEVRQGEKLVEAEALYIEPRNAAVLKRLYAA